MIRQNSKGSLKIFNAKIVNPVSHVKTPISQTAALTQRIMNIVSPGTNRKQASAQKKIVSIDLKPQRKQPPTPQPSPHLSSSNKKILKLRRKTESIDKPYSNSQPRSLAQPHQKRITKVQSSSTLASNPKLKCFDQINYTNSNSNQQNTSRSKQNNWQQIVQSKKQILYEQIYKMDKKLFSLERDLENMGDLGDKRAILEMIKRKGKDKNMGFGPVKPIQIHSNIYKMAKNRIS